MSNNVVDNVILSYKNKPKLKNLKFINKFLYTYI